MYVNVNGVCKCEWNVIFAVVVVHGSQQHLQMDMLQLLLLF